MRTVHVVVFRNPNVRYRNRGRPSMHLEPADFCLVQHTHIEWIFQARSVDEEACACKAQPLKNEYVCSARVKTFGLNVTISCSVPYSIDNGSQ